jgi:large subunit ribosomal protein L3
MTEENNGGSTEAATNSTTSKIDLPTFYGVKAGMTRIFDEQGNHVPVTVIKLIPNLVTKVRTTDKDGYQAYQVGYYEKREKLVTKPVKGQLTKAGIDKNLTRFAEVKADSVDSSAVGKEVSLESFSASTYVDVTGVSKGKGFQGVIKRHNFAGGPAAHGSGFHRTTGSIGQRATPARVFKLKKMPGHMGADKLTIQNLLVVEKNLEKGYILIKGSVPGGKNEIVRISKAIKK